eukprot:superscaffoldBa00007143_g22261
MPTPGSDLVLNVLMLVAHIQQSHALEDNAAFARIIPTRLQVFDYSSISFNCEGYTTDEWSVVRKIKGEVSPCVSNWVTTAYVCAIKPAYPTDSGEYWCEAGEGERSNTVNITITAGSVILESPVLPVMEGDGATLRCRSKKTSAAHIADFYKDGLFFGTSSIGEMTIQSVSKSNEGLYKCSISDFGESPESWLAVRVNVLLLLVTQLHLTYSQKADFPQIVPNRQQHFQYKPITVSCEGLDGLTGWRVMRKIKGGVRICASTLEKSTGPCEITTAYPDYDSGEYWCEIEVKRSNTVNITVTAGSVILESPVLPVMEGENVILRCRNKINSSNLPADFYKDDFIIGSSSTGAMTIQHVSKSVEGLYKCSISGVGESSESWLAVR